MVATPRLVNIGEHHLSNWWFRVNLTTPWVVSVWLGSFGSLFFDLRKGWILRTSHSHPILSHPIPERRRIDDDFYLYIHIHK
jgi:hypothetical protein